MIVTRRSPFSGAIHQMELPVTQAQLDEMELPAHQRRYVQDIFPDLTPAQREFIKTGVTEEEWNHVFPEE